MGEDPRQVHRHPRGVQAREVGRDLFAKNACTTCHGPGGTGHVAGSKSPGPKLAGIYNTMQPMTAGARHG